MSANSGRRRPTIVGPITTTWGERAPDLQGDEIVFKQKLAQINIKPANKNDMDGAFSNLTHALQKVIRVDDLPKEFLVRLEGLILDFQSIRLKEAKK